MTKPSPRPEVATEPDLVRVTEACAICGGIGPGTLSEWERQGIVPPAKMIGGRKFWHRGQLRAALDAYFGVGKALAPESLDGDV